MSIVAWKETDNCFAKLIRNKKKKYYWKILNLRQGAEYELNKKELDKELSNNLLNIRTYIKRCNSEFWNDEENHWKHCGWPEYHKPIIRWFIPSNRQNEWTKKQWDLLTDYAIIQGLRGIKFFKALNIRFTKESIGQEIITARREEVKIKRMLKNLRRLNEKI